MSRRKQQKHSLFIVQEHFAESGSVKVIEVRKNNGIVLDGLTITKTGEQVAPTIYLDGYYQQFQLGEMQLPEIVQDIIRLYEENHLSDFIDGKTFTNFNNVRDCICFKLINLERNSSLLNQIPYVPVLDLTMVFYMLVNHSERRHMTVLITLEHLGYWKVRIEELFSDDDALPMYVLTNSTGINGAACIAYEHVLKDFAEMAAYINHTEVPETDILSGNIYRYNQREDKLEKLHDVEKSSRIQH